AALLGPQPLRPLDRVDRPRAVHAGVVAQAVARDLRQGGRGRVAGHLALHRGHDVAALVQPVPDELCELLLEGHPGVQLAHALRHLGHGPKRHWQLRHRIPSYLQGTAACAALRGRRRRGRRPRRLVGQPLTAPVRPPTMRRSNSEKKMSAGIIDSDVNASTRAVSTEYWEENAGTPSGSVYDISSFRMNSGSMYEFHDATNARMPTVMTPGSDSGTTIRKKKPRRPDPSMAAASSISFGMARRNGTRMMIVVGRANAICGSTMPPIVFISPRSRIRMYSGVIATVIGNMRPAANSEYMAPLSLKSYRASTKLTMSPSATTPRVVSTPATAELPTCRQKIGLASTSR